MRKVYSDLLALYLNKRLGEPGNVKDYFTGHDYPIDEKTGLPFSYGPDGTANTDDDIRLTK